MNKTQRKYCSSNFPLWLCLLLGASLFFLLKVYVNSSYRQIFTVIGQGLGTTLWITLWAYMGALILGLLIALCRCSKIYLLRQVALLYTEMLRGIPMLVILLLVAYVASPTLVGLLNTLDFLWGHYQLRDISFTSRTIVALILGYSAYIAEIVRAGIESIPKGQFAAARSLSLSRSQITIFVVLP